MMNTPTRHEIASIAALLLRSDDLAGDLDKAAAACRMAVHLLDIASFAEGEMKARDAIVPDGIDRWEERQMAIAQRKLLEARKPKFEYPESGRLPWKVFHAHLEPKRPEGDRIPRFKRWLADMENIDPVSASDRVAEFKKEGVPGVVVDYYFTTFFGWWKKVVTEQNAESGKRGAAVKRKRTRK